MKKNNKFLLVIISTFIILIGITTFVSFSSNTNTQEVLVKSITPIYDSTSTVVVDSNNVVFNDKNQEVEYKVVIENTQNYNVKITDIQLSTPTEEFLTYEIKNINENDIVEANSTKELIISLETTGIKGWGRNFNDELTANISFEKVRKNEPVDPPKEEDNKEQVETPKEEVKQPEPPAPTIKEVLEKIEKIEPTKVTKDVIVFKEEIKVEVGDKIAVWIYSEPIFLGYFDVIETNGVKQIIGLEEALKKVDIQVGEHNIVLATEEGETLGYVEVYVSENNQLSEESPEEGKIENPYTNTGWLIVYVTVAGIAVIGIFILRNKKVNKYFILFISLSSVLSLVKAEDPIDVSITLNVGFESQNVMKPSEFEWDSYDGGFISDSHGVDYWTFAPQIKNFYIQNEIVEIPEYDFEFDVTEAGNGRVMAYLVEKNDDQVCYDFEWEEDICYDLYLQADGIIYPNENASHYFAIMKSLENISNLAGIDTSEVTNMSGMFSGTGEYSDDFTLDVSNLETSNVTDMSCMFCGAGLNSKIFTLDVSNFDTSKVINMHSMFLEAGYESENFNIDVSNFDTSNVTDMSYMFAYVGESNKNFTLDVSNFDTSEVTNMGGMFNNTGYNSENFALDLSNFDTSNVTNMSDMFVNTGYSNPNFTLDVSNFDTSNVTDMSYMFMMTGYNSETLTLDLSNLDTSKVTNMSGMFQYAGYSNPNFTLDVSNFDTSNVTDMSYMFEMTGYNSETLTLDLSNLDTSKVTNMSGMFQYAGYNSETLTLDVSSFDTSNVTNMSEMFNSAGYNSKNFTLDVSKFDTSKVTDMSYMFAGTGYNSTKLNTSIILENPDVKSYNSTFYDVATKDGTQISVHYTKDTEELLAQIIATKSPASNVFKGNSIDSDEYTPIGTEIDISGEKFNVISRTEDTITMLAKYNLGTDYKQNTTENGIVFSERDGWEYKPGPKEVDIEEWTIYPKIYVNEYVEYLKAELNDDFVTGNLITLKELGILGCTVPNDYGKPPNLSGRMCANSPYKSWIINSQYWWTRSTNPSAYGLIWSVFGDGAVNYMQPTEKYGIRPVITVSKEALNNYLKSS